LVILLTVGLANEQRKAAAFVSPVVVADVGLNRTSRQRLNQIDSADMVYIPPGAFMMGSDAAELDQLWRKFGWPEEEATHKRRAACASRPGGHSRLASASRC